MASLLKRYKEILFVCQTCTRNISNRATCGKIKRKYYERLYPTTVVLPNGATINVRYPQPRQIIKLPIDITKLSPEEQAALKRRRQPKTEIEVEKEIEDNFDRRKYLQYMNKSK
ncbi:39S ribosomal protein L55, mitochondrial-like isoform X2 [Ostrea edulis]|uniref:39S ribosomal protein L55, mitochondrial-like isoform X2 n=1 Tax=Ostrea edulis TaxID=37623 RepID=UPI0024AFCC14|nr:39S ribosomal protein L55, mitochondrial-like isoform X2 [Ostrea edulis]